MSKTSTPTAPTPAVSVVPSPDRLALTYAEAARAVGCSPRTIWAACASGDLRAARVGRRRLISVAELRRWLDERAGIAIDAAKGDAR